MIRRRDRGRIEREVEEGIEGLIEISTGRVRQK
jgi:hypothetical protein